MKLKAQYLLLFFALFLSAATFAQRGGNPGKGKNAPKDFVAETVDFYTKELKLDDFQKAAVRAVMEEQREPVNELMAMKDITRDERRDRSKALNDRVDEKIKPILTPEQLKRYIEIQDKKKF